jgi:predicted nucleic acid-binding Zn ribbon protein
MIEFDEDIEDPDEPDDVDGVGDETPCPYCGKDIYEQAEICPYCRSFISHEDAPPRRRPLWLWIGFLLALVGALIWIGFHY